ncbi:hypothetical protein DH2020_010564 [Rehmannia glutinosa]|uniref:AT3G52170-like helix-turn-helix domain-containing protein n=1 Tax=Rehmannia glutinosa TaxID=99300 RepID=A0ABR0XBP8_REHGL
MHATKVGWAGQAFALATSNDSGGKKSRIRRSKEERKGMVESFIKKYQKSNNGNFPSLNLAHKEVGGSFYTVRELVREIIQENRVLAPPKVSLEENGHSGFLEQHPLGSISMEPEIDFTVSSDGVHTVTHIVPQKYQSSSEENISSYIEQFNGSYPLELDNEQIIEELSKVADKNEGFDGTIESHQAPNYQDTHMQEVSNHGEQLTQLKSHEFENEKIVNGFEVNGPGSQRLTNEHYNKNDETVDKNEEYQQRVYTETTVTEILDKEKYEAQDLEASQTVKSRVNSDVVVETFPLRPVPKTIHDMDVESSDIQEAAGTLEATPIPSGFVIAKGEEKLRDEKKVVVNLQGSSMEGPIYSSASDPIVLDKGDVADLESEDSLPDGTTKASSSTERLNSADPTAVGRKTSGQDNSSLPKGNNPTLDRINLDTWERTSKKSTRPESNPLLALVKAFISSFVKFWTE